MLKNKKLIIKILISTVLFGVIFYQVDKDTLFNQISLLNWRIAPLVVLFLILNYVISSIRWKSLLVHGGGDKASVAYLTNLYFIGAFFNNFMPTSIGGDAYKIYKLGQKTGNTTHAFSATFMERFTGVIALTIISVMSLVNLLGILGIGLFFLFWAGVIFGFFVLRWIAYANVNQKFLSKIFKKLGELYFSIIEYKKFPKQLFWAFITSFIVQLLAVFSQYFVFRAIGADIPLVYSMFAFPFIFLAGYAIPSINGIGVQDFLYIKMFATVGITSEVALSASILYHLFRLFVSLIGGFLYALGKDE